MMNPCSRSALAAILVAGLAGVVPTGAQAQQAQDPGFWGWFSGPWSLTLGGAAMVAPRYEGAKDMAFSPQPIISLSKAGPGPRFVSRNDNISFALVDTGTFRMGPVGDFIWPRDKGTSHDLRGLSDIPFGGEAGIFADVYPMDWLRLRAEVRHGIRSHHGLVADFYADAFADVLPGLQLSGGPRLSLASQGYFDAYYGVDRIESAASGLAVYSPGGGLKSVGWGGALTWKTTDRLETSLFGEYSRLLGPAADSSLVKQRGSENQFMIGVSATYRFDFTL